MNTKNLIIAFSICSILFACKKETPGYTDDKYSFNGSIDAATISVNDSAGFRLTDNPDIISFYSGESGNNYDNKDRTVLTGGTLKMKFESRVKNQIADTLDVLVSSNFSGVYDSANIANATWTKLTPNFIFPDALTALGSYVPSGPTPGDFTALGGSVVSGQPFYLAFKYDVKVQNNIEWTIRKLGMYNFFTNGNTNATVIDSNTNTSGSFVGIPMGEPLTRWSISSTLYKYNNSSVAAIGASHWFISRQLNPDAVTPDLPIVIKNISQSPVTRFKYKYSAPGTYKAVFVASYKRLNFEKTFVKEFTVVVQ